MKSSNSTLIVKPVGDKFELVVSYTYRDVTVPQHYQTNGMDYKLRILGLILHKYDPRCLEAVVIHDYLCDMEDYDKADKYFGELLPDIWQKKFMIKAVKRYHKIKY